MLLHEAHQHTVLRVSLETPLRSQMSNQDHLWWVTHRKL